MSGVSEIPAASESRQFVPYRSVSKTAIISFVLAFLSLASLLTPMFIALPLAGLLFGLAGLINIRRFPNELTGRFLAISGMVICTLWIAGAASAHTYTYVTEVPDGYERMSFWDLKPEKGADDIIPASARSLDGKRVFVKGYVHPGVASQGDIREFILVGDMGTCCFGGQPKLTDMISVRLKRPLHIHYSQRIRRLAGTLRVSTEVKEVAGGLSGGIYELEADYLK